MKNIYFSLSLSVALASTAFVANSLEPGIYRLEPESQLTAAVRLPGLSSSDKEYFEHAVPLSAEVRYAAVSHDPASNLNKIVFLVGKDYRYDVNSPNKLCVSYAFPDWNYMSASNPFCRTGISDDYEAILKGSTTSFTVSWAPKSDDHSHYAPPVRPPTDEEIGACALGVCEPAAYGGITGNREIIYYSDRFNLEKPRTYVDTLYLRKDVPAYVQAFRDPAPTQLAKGSYVEVLAVNPEWFEVEQIEQAGSIFHGWINRDDMLYSKWVLQKVRTKDFLFRVALTMDEEATDSGNDVEPLLPVAIEVLARKTQQRVQVVRDFSSEQLVTAQDEILNVIDVNFDGFPDLTITGMSGGAGPNSSTNVFLFDKHGKKFVFDEVLSELSQLNIDTIKRTITSAQRNGCCSHSSETYRYIDGKLTLVATQDESLTADGTFMEITNGYIKNGKMKYRKQRTKVPETN